VYIERARMCTSRVCFGQHLHTLWQLLGFRSGAVKVSVLLGCDTTSQMTDIWQFMIHFTFKGLISSNDRTFGMRLPHCLRTSGMWCHISEKWKPQFHTYVWSQFKMFVILSTHNDGTGLKHVTVYITTTDPEKLHSYHGKQKIILGW
jgi:hypothetical protein